MDYVDLLEMFPSLTDCGAPRETLSRGKVTGATVEREKRVMTLNVSFDRALPPVYAAMVERKVERDYGLTRCTLNVTAPESAGAGKAPQKAAPKSASGPKPGKPLFGKIYKGDTTPMGELSLDSGRVTVTGKIFAVNSRDVRSGALVLSFDMTDGTGSVRVSKFVKEEPVKAAVKTLEAGMTVTCQGFMS